MIDKYILKFCGAIDNFCDSIAKMLESNQNVKRKNEDI